MMTTVVRLPHNDSMPRQQRRRILLVVNHLSTGGASVALLRLATGLRDRGHSVKVMFLQKLEDVPVDPSLDVTFALFGRARRFWDYLRITVRLNSVLASEKPDVVISFLPLANIIAQTLATAHRIPHRIASQRNPASSYGRIVRAIDYVIGTLGAYTSNVMVSHSAAASFGKWPKAYKDRITVVQNGIVFAPSEKQPEQVRRNFGLPPDRVLILSVGRLTDQKNHAVLIRALPDLPDANLVIAGEGELRRALEELAADNAVTDRVAFLGSVSREGVRDLLKAADIFALSSVYEGLSNALLEALHAGVPIVASNIGPNVEVLQDDNGKKYGLLFDPNDLGSLVAALKHLVNDPRARQHMAAAALVRAKGFSEEAMITGFEALFS